MAITASAAYHWSSELRFFRLWSCQQLPVPLLHPQILLLPSYEPPRPSWGLCVVKKIGCLTHFIISSYITFLNQNCNKLHEFSMIYPKVKCWALSNTWMAMFSRSRRSWRFEAKGMGWDWASKTHQEQTHQRKNVKNHQKSWNIQRSNKCNWK